MIVIVYEENPDLENILNDKENGIQNIIKYWTGKVTSPSYYFSSVFRGTSLILGKYQSY